MKDSGSLEKNSAVKPRKLLRNREDRLSKRQGRMCWDIEVAT